MGVLVRLEVTVHDAVVVQVLQGQHGFRKVQTHHVHGQGPDVLQQSGTVSSCNKVAAVREGPSSLLSAVSGLVSKAPGQTNSWETLVLETVTLASLLLAWVGDSVKGSRREGEWPFRPLPGQREKEPKPLCL